MENVLFGFVTILLVVVVVLIASYRIMIGIAPHVTRPAASSIDQTAIAELEARLMQHVRQLSVEIGERTMDRPDALEAAALYIEQQLATFGYDVRHETYDVRSARGVTRTCRNLIAELPGTGRPEDVVLIGAHYDTVPDCPGANDNGSGVAALLEIARSLARDGTPAGTRTERPGARSGESPRRTLRFVAFVNEEPPYFNRHDMGSQLHARLARERGDRIVAMLALETIGYYTDEPGSQQYPAPLDRFYPDTGNFLTVVGNVGSRTLVRTTMRHFMAASDFPVEGAAVPAAVPGVGWSDHRSFWEQGYDAVMLTDTAPFRYAEYHTPEDLPDRMNPTAYARVVHGILAVARGLASGE